MSQYKLLSDEKHIEDFYKTHGTTLGNDYFKLTSNTKISHFEKESTMLFQIEATKDFNFYDLNTMSIVTIKAGTKGGFVEFKENLCDGTWIDESVEVYGRNTYISHAYITGESKIGHANIYQSYINESCIIGSSVSISCFHKVISKRSDFTNVVAYDTYIEEATLNSISTIHKSYVKKSKVNNIFIRYSRIENSSLQSRFSTSIINSSINELTTDKKFRFVDAYINGKFTYYEFSRVGTFAGDMIFHCNKEGRWQISFDGMCEEIYDFEKWWFKHDLYGGHNKSISKLIDFVQVSTGFKQKRLTWYERIKLYFEAITLKITYI